jgi:hypothetical protein
MINLKVDEAYAFDYLSILYIKKDRSQKCYQIWKDCFDFLSVQLTNFIEIINSHEYINLLEANKITFEAVEKARYGNISAKAVDEANMLRHKRKIELQKKFFNKNLEEFKT